MRKITGLILAGILAATFSIPAASCAKPEQKIITAFVGSASKPPMEEAAQAFEQETGIKVELTFGGSGSLLSQMKLSRSGDLYIQGSPDYMLKAEKEGIIDPSSEAEIAYLIPVIAVQHGNPKNIKSLADFARPAIKVAIADPASVCVGLYAIEILEHNGLLDDIQQAGTVVTYAESCEKTATLIALKSVDAVIGWDVFAAWNPGSIDAVYLQPAQTPRIAYIPAAISTFARDKTSAQKFLDFLVSPAGQAIFKKAGYITTEAEARKFAPDARIGGEYQLPVTYKPLVK